MTFSIAARCATTGMFGMAVSSSSPAVAARCAFARAKTGAASTQNITDPTLGPRLLDALQAGASADQAMQDVVSSTPYIEYRQLTVVDETGSTAWYSGPQTLGTYAAANADNVVCAGNMLANTNVPASMVDAFTSSSGHLGDRLLAAMLAGEVAGGEAGPVHSAGLLMVDAVSWPVASLRVDWHESGDPVGELIKVWNVYSPQLNDYVTRAQNPSVAPGYGVPGDDSES